MKDEIKNELNDIGSGLADMQGSTPFSTPNSYFSELSERLTDTATSYIDVQLLPVPTNPYQVPEGYFERLPDSVRRIVFQSKSGLVISFGALRWAAAAVLLIMIGLGTYNFMGDNETIQQKNVFLATVGENDIEEYLGYAYHANNDVIASPSRVDKIDVSINDIVNYLNETGWGDEDNF